METIKFEDFAKLEIRIGKILSAEKVENSNKLLKLTVDFGPASAEGSDEAKDEKRQILAGIAKFYTPEDLVGKQCPFAFNLEPKSLGGLESQGMILCPSDENGPVLLHPDKPVPPGAKIK